MASSLVHLSKPYILSQRRLRCITSEFNISFAPPKSNQQPQFQSPKPSSQTQSVPWIARDENGNLTLQSSRFLDDSTQKKKKKEKQKKDTGIAKSTSQPKYSKAARRFYNDRFRDPPQRLAKVLAAAGGCFLSPLRSLLLYITFSFIYLPAFPQSCSYHITEYHRVPIKHK